MFFLLVEILKTRRLDVPLPFAHTVLRLRITIFVTLLRHREALLSFNEESQTYKKKENLAFRLKS